MSYVDLTSEFIFKRYLTYQDLNRLAANDAYDHLPGGTVKCFYQQTPPVGWLKQTVVDDAMVRVVDGAGGGNGGAAGFLTGFQLAHTHTVNGHTHAVPVHVHILDSDTAAAGHKASGSNIGPASATYPAGLYRLDSAGSGGKEIFNDTVNSVGGGGGDGDTEPTAPVTVSALANILIRYLDVIVCAKGS